MHSLLTKGGAMLAPMTPEGETEYVPWEQIARPKQLAPDGDWRVWQILAGRGWGKTRTGSEWIYQQVKSGYRRIALVSDIAADTRDVMVEGDSGIIAICPPWDKPKYEPSKRRVTWANGAKAILYAAESPGTLRGPQHDTAWCDELAKWQNLRKKDEGGGTAWDNLMMGLRVGKNPRCLVTTTPRPIPLVKTLIARENTVVTIGSSYENRANLAEAWYTDNIAPYEGTRLGRQEIDAEILEDIEGALWQRQWIDDNRVTEWPELIRIGVGVDPMGSVASETAEAGIIVGGIDRAGDGYLLGDYSLNASPERWAGTAISALATHCGDRVVVETNFGGDMVESVLRAADPNVPLEKVTASRGKIIRAEPIAALYEQGRIHHVGSFPKLEDEMCSYVPGDRSPNRMDAAVWILTWLMLGQHGSPVVLL